MQDDDDDDNDMNVCYRSESIAFALVDIQRLVL